jgi:hypothetical protein
MFELMFKLGLIVSLLRRLNRKQDNFMATVTEAFAEQAAVANKAFGEIASLIEVTNAKVAQLEAALANRELTGEEAAALEELKTATKKLDDIVPDELPTEPPADTEPEA